MFRSSRYKRNQGRIARQLTFAAMAATVAIGAWKISSAADDNLGRYIVPLAVLAAGAWAAFRIVNIPRFAEFLISVENEMNKVSWPSRTELYRASMVVIVVIFLLTAILLAYDLVLRSIIGWLLGGGGE
jgi:preprotein translocase subunit SecE